MESKVNVNGLKLIVRDVYIDTSDATKFRYRADIQCTKENFDGKFAPGVENSWTDIDFTLPGENGFARNYPWNGKKFTTEILPQNGPRSGSKGYERWFASSRENIRRSSDFGRLVKQGYYSKVSGIKATEGIQKLINFLEN